MKKLTSFCLFLVMLNGCAERDPQPKPGVWDLRVSISPTERGPQFRICQTPLSSAQLSVILQKAKQDYEAIGSQKPNSGMNVVYLLDSRLSITNLYAALVLAEKAGISNIVLRLGQKEMVKSQCDYIE